MSRPYRHTPDMGMLDVPGDADQELRCQDMLEAGVRWLNENATGSTQVRVGYEVRRDEVGGYCGAAVPLNGFTESLSQVVLKASGGKARVDQHHVVMRRLEFIAEHGWDRYCAALRSLRVAPRPAHTIKLQENP